MRIFLFSSIEEETEETLLQQIQKTTEICCSCSSSLFAQIKRAPFYLHSINHQLSPYFNHNPVNTKSIFRTILQNR